MHHIPGRHTGHSGSHEQQLKDLQQCFNRLRANGLKLNIAKCAFGQSEVAYLGHTLTSKGILPGVDKTKAIRDFQPPKNIRQIREFVGLCNYCLLYTSPSPRDGLLSRMPSSA